MVANHQYLGRSNSLQALCLGLCLRFHLQEAVRLVSEQCHYVSQPHCKNSAGLFAGERTGTKSLIGSLKLTVGLDTIGS